MKKRELILFSALMLLIGFLGAYIGLKVMQPEMIASNNTKTPFTSKSTSENEEIGMIQEAYELIDAHYVEGVEDGQLLEGAIQGMLDSLEDPYSSYMNAEAMEKFTEQIESSFQGIGAEVSIVDGKVTIISPIKNSPAEKSGLRSNDQILEVDGESLEGLDLNEAVSKIRGEKGSEVVLLIQRKGSTKATEYTIVRDDIPIETVYEEMKNIDGKKTGVIQVTSFSETTADEFTEALNKLEDEGMEGLVIDVRGNPGGLLDAIEDMLQHFIPSDVPYLQVEDGEGKIDKYYTNLKEKKAYPINVIVDEGSASASEILAVAMKEVGYDIVGETTFGKGTVQQAVPIGEDSGESTVKLTFYKWLSPKGNWIHDKGVKPTIEQKQPDYFYSNPIQLENTLKYDQTDEEIKHAQVMLKGLGFDPKRSDGYFDEATKKAVEAFQKEQKLKVTGEIDEETAGAIESEVLEKIRSEEEDLQMKKALDVLYQ